MIRHIFRTFRYMLYGALVHPAAGPYDAVVTKIFVGPRMLDAFFHVNNAKYLEIFEFSRWNHGIRTGFNWACWRGGCYPVVAAVHLCYISQMKAFQVVRVQTRVVGCNKKAIFIAQKVYAPNRHGGERVFCTVLLKAAVIDARATKSGTTMLISEALHRMGMAPAPDTLPIELQQLNDNFPEHMKAMCIGEELWRNEFRPPRKGAITPEDSTDNHSTPASTSPTSPPT